MPLPTCVDPLPSNTLITNYRLCNSTTLAHLLTPSRTQSQSLSLPGTTLATTIGHVHWNSFGPPGAEHDGQQLGHLQSSPVNINDNMKATGSAGMEDGAATAAAGVGLGVALSPINSEVSSFTNLYTYIYLLLWFKKRPPRLLLTPSNAALKESAPKTIAVDGEDEERGHMSDVRLEYSCLIVSDN